MASFSQRMNMAALPKNYFDLLNLVLGLSIEKSSLFLSHICKNIFSKDAVSSNPIQGRIFLSQMSVVRLLSLKIFQVIK
jgi:hypothetical protein